MREYKIITKTLEQKELIKETCDKCQKEINIDSFNAYNSNWFELITGTNYPGAYSPEKYKMDLCEDCSMDLIELLKANGFNVQYEEE